MTRIPIVTGLLALAVCGWAGIQKERGKSLEAKSITWEISNLSKIDGNPVTVLGAPSIVETGSGKALSFNGHNDGIVLDVNPIDGASAFTIEAVFQPAAGGEKEQRWLHVEAADNEDRALLEIRLDGDKWFLDTFIKGGEARLPLYAENFKHPVGPWYHVALVYDGAEMRHYVNGQLELSGALKVNPLKGGKTSLGVRMNRVYWFKGLIRKARFTNAALTPDKFMPL